MQGRLSLRAQLAVALGLTLLLGAALNAVITLALFHRALRAEARACSDLVAHGAAGQLAAGCPAAGAESIAGRPGRDGVRLAVESAPPPRGSTAAGARLEDGRFLVADTFQALSQRVLVAPSMILAYLLLNGSLVFLVGFVLLNRSVGRPVDRLVEAAERIERLELEEPLGPRGPLLGRLGSAFERMARSLKQERDRVAAQIAELQRLNRQLAEARDTLVRSEKLATTGRLAAGVAHEIGNPLGAILGYLELARSGSPPEARRYLDCIDHEVGRIDRTVRELLDFSRPSGGAPALAPVGLRQAVDSAVRLASVQKRLKHVRFEVEVPEGLQVLAEGHHLSQVLINVLLNAGDAMSGEGAVRIRASRIDDETGSRIELLLADSGPGIAPAELARIFDPFYTTKAPGEGTGLGLAICHRIMESFGGEIRAENRPEGGAVFTLVFRPGQRGQSMARAV